MLNMYVEMIHVYKASLMYPRSLYSLKNSTLSIRRYCNIASIVYFGFSQEKQEYQNWFNAAFGSNVKD